MRYLMMLLVLGCRNDAITYAHALAPGAQCTALETSTGFGERGSDRATCRVGNEIWLCIAYGTEPNCKTVGRIQSETP